MKNPVRLTTALLFDAPFGLIELLLEIGR